MFVVKFMGGLGNQLLQLNFCYYLKEHFPTVEIKCDITSYKKTQTNSTTDSIHGGFLISKLPFETIDTIEWRKFILVKSAESDSIPNININYNYYFEGYWPLKIPFKKYFDFDDAFKTESISELNKNIENKILSYGKDSVAVHIRCGDYNNLFNLGNVSTKSYYNNAIKYILQKLEKPYFFIFSNDLEWAKKNIEIHENIFFVESNNEKEGALWDLYLMSKCSHFIISNSSFSLWAQFFSNNDKKIVLTPEYWTNVKTAYSIDGTSAFQKFPYMKSIQNIPSQETTNPELYFFIKPNKNILSLRRFIVAALNQYSDNIKIIIITKSKKIKNILDDYKTINSCISIASTHKEILSEKRNAHFYSYITPEYYLLQDCLENLFTTIKENANYNKIYIPFITQPKGNIIKCNSKKYKVPIICNNKVQNNTELLLNIPFFCYVDYNKKDYFEIYKLYLKNFIKKILY